MRMLAVGAALAALVSATPALAGDLVVRITGIKAKGGALQVGLYDQASFLHAKPTYFLRVPVTQVGETTVMFKAVTPGDYAVSAFHDADGNGTLTMTPEHRLAEGTAMSNAEKLRGAPTFDVNKITVPAAESTVTIAMSYPEDRKGYW